MSRVRKELGKRPRGTGSGERSRSGKKARLPAGDSSGVVCAGASPRPPMLIMEEVEARSPRVEGVATIVEEQRVEGDVGGAAKTFGPLVVDLVDSPEEVSLVPAKGMEGPPMAAKDRGESTIEEPLLEEFGGGDAGPATMEAREEASAGESLLAAVGEAGEGGEALMGPAGEELVLAGEEEVQGKEGESAGEGEELLVEGGELAEDPPGEIPPVKTSGILASGLAEVSEESQIAALSKEADRLKAFEAARGSSSDAPPGGSGSATEAEFAALMRSVLCPGTDASSDRFANLELVDAAFGQRNVV